MKNIELIELLGCYDDDADVVIVADCANNSFCVLDPTTVHGEEDEHDRPGVIIRTEERGPHV